MEMVRRRTTQSGRGKKTAGGRRTKSFQIAALQPSPEGKKPTQKFSSYHNFPAHELRNFLETKYKDQEIEIRPTLQKDYYEWDVPPGAEPLTEEDFKELKELRDRLVREANAQASSSQAANQQDDMQPRPLTPE